MLLRVKKKKWVPRPKVRRRCLRWGQTQQVASFYAELEISLLDLNKLICRGNNSGIQENKLWESFVHTFFSGIDTTRKEKKNLWKPQKSGSITESWVSRTGKEDEAKNKLSENVAWILVLYAFSFLFLNFTLNVSLLFLLLTINCCLLLENKVHCCK